MEKRLSSLKSLRVIHAARQALKTVLVLAVLCAGFIGAVFAYFSLAVLPSLDDYRPRLEAALSDATGRTVRVERLSGRWAGIAPELKLEGVQLANPRSGEALRLASVALVPSWRSLAAFDLRLARLTVEAPQVEVVRGRDGRLYINGLGTPIGGNASDRSLFDWLLQQGELEIRDARITWQDEFLGLPRVGLSRGNLLLENGLFGHSLKVFGQPSSQVGRSAALQARWRGDTVSRWREWKGTIEVSLQGARVKPWAKYVERLGVLRAGEGDGVGELTFSQGRLDRLSAELQVSNARYQPPRAGELSLPRFGGRLLIEREGRAYRIEASRLTLASETGLAFDNANITGRFEEGAQGSGEFALDNADLAPLSPFIHALGADRNPLFARFSPAGKVRDFKAGWTGPVDAPATYHLSSRFAALAWQPFGPMPGVAGVDGRVRFDNRGGELVLDTGRASVTMPLVFANTLAFDRLQAEARWTFEGQGVRVRLPSVRFGNADLTGSVQGEYFNPGQGAGQINLTGGIDAVPAARVPDYLPYAAGRHTAAWLAQALKRGTARNARFILRGDLGRFPFRGGQGGEFSVEADTDNVTLAFGQDWPTIDGIDAALRFHNEKMEILSRRASTADVPLHGVRVTIPDLGADIPMLNIAGEARGPLPAMLRYTTLSPVDRWLDGLTGRIESSGPASLKLQLGIPLHGDGRTAVRGDLDFAGNPVTFRGWPIPTLQDTRGRLTFTDSGVEIAGLRVSALGGVLRLDAHTDAQRRMHFTVGGNADSRQVMQNWMPALAPHVEGRADYRVAFSVLHGLESLTVSSPLTGTRSLAPPPASKAAAEVWPLQVKLTPGRNHGWNTDFSIDKRADGRLRLDDDGHLLAAQIGIGQPAAPAVDGQIGVGIRAAQLDLGAWSRLAGGLPGETPASGGRGQGLVVSLNVDRLRYGRYQLAAVHGRVERPANNSRWQIALDSKEVRGQAGFVPTNGGQLDLHLERLALPLPSGEGVAGDTPDTGQSARWPAIRAQVDSFLYRGEPLGRLTVNARRDGPAWQLEQLLLVNDEGRFAGDLTVTPGSHVDVRYSVETQDLGRLLARFGQRDTFRRGSGTLSGQLRWPGSVEDFAVAHLSGSARVNLVNGQFAKADPGVARLLGVLSLQSLPRRIRLDFTDVFSEGFAFDTLTGHAGITEGVFTSDSIRMRGPAADVAVQGRVDMRSETQDLMVTVQPHVADSLAIAAGAAFVNPLAGVAALAAQKVLKDPVGKMLSVQYAITGPITDPQIKRAGSGAKPR
ncbi:YhdP family protein [Gulbenkiania mobilis]|uniref:YhdP family protein n=1 Tax=Gulbenkiania mobilis TaxID=397457 RepID=UPI0006BC09FF|nr:YhdP family protein [Gulbenkiania mobilis]